MSRRFCYCLPLVLWLTACSSLRPGAPEAEPEEPLDTGAVEPAADARPDPPAQPEPPQPSPLGGPSLDADIEQLLADADAALQDDRLTTPVNDNAFDRYQAVLLLRPKEPRALAGLQQIFDRYVQMIRGAITAGDPSRASALLARARLVDNDNPKLAELDQAVAELRQQVGTPDAEEEAADNEIPLDTSALDRKDPKIVERLQALAKKLSETRESLLIVARNDAEGRWIYQTMNKTVPESRVRGDIRLGRQPKIVLLPPIESPGE